uniref:Uncharacterized protein n=1 Tax=Rhizophora mucronata TaxID=61149 RepID=A0A2P2JVX8_RHIMU
MRKHFFMDRLVKSQKLAATNRRKKNKNKKSKHRLDRVDC